MLRALAIIALLSAVPAPLAYALPGPASLIDPSDAQYSAGEAGAVYGLTETATPTEPLIAAELPTETNQLTAESTTVVLTSSTALELEDVTAIQLATDQALEQPIEEQSTDGPLIADMQGDTEVLSDPFPYPAGDGTATPQQYVYTHVSLDLPVTAPPAPSPQDIQTEDVTTIPPVTELALEQSPEVPNTDWPLNADMQGNTEILSDPSPFPAADGTATPQQYVYTDVSIDLPATAPTPAFTQDIQTTDLELLPLPEPHDSITEISSTTTTEITCDILTQSCSALGSLEPNNDIWPTPDDRPNFQLPKTSPETCSIPPQSSLTCAYIGLAGVEKVVFEPERKRKNADGTDEALPSSCSGICLYNHPVITDVTGTECPKGCTLSVASVPSWDYQCPEGHERRHVVGEAWGSSSTLKVSIKSEEECKLNLEALCAGYSVPETTVRLDCAAPEQALTILPRPLPSQVSFPESRGILEAILWMFRNIDRLDNAGDRTAKPDGMLSVLDIRGAIQECATGGLRKPDAADFRVACPPQVVRFLDILNNNQAFAMISAKPAEEIEKLLLASEKDPKVTIPVSAAELLSSIPGLASTFRDMLQHPGNYIL